MKYQNRIWICSLIVMGFLLMLASSCQKDETLTDYASEIVGTYNGTITVVGTGTVPSSSKLTKSSEQVVDLEIYVGSSSTSLDGIKVSSSGSNIYTLSYTDSSGSFVGKVEENILTWTLTAGSVSDTFSGTK